MRFALAWEPESETFDVPSAAKQLFDMSYRVKHMAPGNAAAVGTPNEVLGAVPLNTTAPPLQPAQTVIAVGSKHMADNPTVPHTSPCAAISEYPLPKSVPIEEIANG